MTIKTQDDDDKNKNKRKKSISKGEPEIVAFGGADHDEEEPDIVVTVETTTVEDQHPPELTGSGSDTVPSTNTSTSTSTAPTDNAEELEEFEFPNVFYCPITLRLLEDPVVAPNGDSYERSAILLPLEQGDSDVLLAAEIKKQQLLYYPNRALQSVIEETKRQTGKGLHAGWMRWQHGMQQTLHQAILPPGEFRPLPEAYYCPITFHLIHDPVIDPEGNTYERVAIENWIRANGISPITRSIMSLAQLYPNHAIRQLLTEEKQRDERTMHPSIRLFKTEAPPLRSDPEVGGNLVTADPTTTTTTSTGAANDSSTTPTSRTTTGFGAAGPRPNDGTHHYPTTYTELEQRRHQRRRVTVGFIGLVFAAMCLAAFIIYGGVFFLMLFVISLTIVFSRRHNYNWSSSNH